MGTDRTDYVMLAVKFPYETVAYDEDKYDKYLDLYEDNGYRSEIKEHDGLTMVSDGMSGEYAFVGKVLAKAVEEEGEGLPITDCSIVKNSIEMQEKISNIFGVDKAHIDIKIWVFTHWH